MLFYGRPNKKMNGYQLIMKLQRRIAQDPNFANRFNKAVADLNRIPGLQQEVLRIMQMNIEAQRQKALDSLPKQAKHTVEDLLKMLNN